MHSPLPTSTLADRLAGMGDLVAGEAEEAGRLQQLMLETLQCFIEMLIAFVERFQAGATLPPLPACPGPGIAATVTTRTVPRMGCRSQGVRATRRPPSDRIVPARVRSRRSAGSKPHSPRSLGAKTATGPSRARSGVSSTAPPPCQPVRRETHGPSGFARSFRCDLLMNS